MSLYELCGLITSVVASCTSSFTAPFYFLREITCQRMSNKKESFLPDQVARQPINNFLFISPKLSQ